MARNKIDDLRDHLFVLLEALNDDEMTDEQRNAAIEKAQAGAMLGKVIVDSLKTEIVFHSRNAQVLAKGGDMMKVPLLLETKK
jgi:hypothetical protein